MKRIEKGSSCVSPDILSSIIMLRRDFLDVNLGNGAEVGVGKRFMLIRKALVVPFLAENLSLTVRQPALLTEECLLSFATYTSF